MSLSETPSWKELNESFQLRRRPDYDETLRLAERIHGVVVRDGKLYVVHVEQPARHAFNRFQPTGQPVALKPVGEFYTFHTVNWNHRMFRASLREVYASMSPELLGDQRICGVSVRAIYGTTTFGGHDWHIGICTAYVKR